MPPQPLDQTTRDDPARTLSPARPSVARPAASPTGPDGTLGPAATSEAWSRARLVSTAGPLATVVLMAAGLLPMALAVDGSRDGAGTADQAWWVLGLVIVYLPAALAVTWPGLRSSTRLLVAVSMTLLLQVGQVALVSTGSGGSLGAAGSAPGSPYVGLGTATDAIRSLSGLPTDTSAAVVLLAARLVLALTVLLLVTRLTGSVRIGAGALVVYAGQPQLLALDPPAALAALALPLAVLTVYLVFQRREAHRLSLLPAGLVAVAVSLVDGLTAVLLVLVLATWAGMELVDGRRERARAPALVALVTLGTSAAVLVRSGDGVRAVLDAAVATSTRPSARPWETVLTVAAVVLTLVVLLPALWRARVLVELRVGLVLMLLLAALLHPLVLAGLLLGAEGGLGALLDRVAGFVILGAGFVVAWWLWQHRVRWWMALPIALGATAVFLGSVVLGSGPVSGQLPGPSPVADVGRTDTGAGAADAESVAVADWMRANLPAGSTVLAPRTDGVPASSYGDLTVLDRLGAGLDASRLILDPEISAADRAALRARDVRYVVADRRGSSGSRPVSRAAVQTFSTMAGADVVYDGGSIQVLDLGSR